MAAVQALYKPGPRYPRSYRELEKKDIGRLTAILAHAPSPTTSTSAAIYHSYVKFTQEEIRQLPAHLRSMHSSRALDRLLGSRHQGAQDGCLCDLHARLNERLVGSVFRFVRREIDVKIPAFLGRIRSELAQLPQYKDLLGVLDDVPGMWMPGGKYFKLFGHKPPIHYARQANACRACVLARLGSDPLAISALWVGVKLRVRDSKTANPEASVRVAWIEGWMAGLGEPACKSLLKASKSIYANLKAELRASKPERSGSSSRRPLDTAHARSGDTARVKYHDGGDDGDDNDDGFDPFDDSASDDNDDNGTLTSARLDGIASYSDHQLIPDALSLPSKGKEASRRQSAASSAYSQAINPYHWENDLITDYYGPDIDELSRTISDSLTLNDSDELYGAGASTSHANSLDIHSDSAAGSHESMATQWKVRYL